MLSYCSIYSSMRTHILILSYYMSYCSSVDREDARYTAVWGHIETHDAYCCMYISSMRTHRDTKLILLYLYQQYEDTSRHETHTAVCISAAWGHIETRNSYCCMSISSMRTHRDPRPILLYISSIRTHRHPQRSIYSSMRTHILILSYPHTLIYSYSHTALPYTPRTNHILIRSYSQTAILIRSYPHTLILSYCSSTDILIRSYPHTLILLFRIHRAPTTSSYAHTALLQLSSYAHILISSYSHTALAYTPRTHLDVRVLRLELDYCCMCVSCSSCYQTAHPPRHTRPQCSAWRGERLWSPLIRAAWA
jgi:hypothetical protein